MTTTEVTAHFKLNATVKLPRPALMPRSQRRRSIFALAVELHLRDRRTVTPALHISGMSVMWLEGVVDPLRTDAFGCIRLDPTVSHPHQSIDPSIPY